MTRALFNLSRLNIAKAINYNSMIVLAVIPIFFIIKDALNTLIHELRKFNDN